MATQPEGRKDTSTYELYETKDTATHELAVGYVHKYVSYAVLTMSLSSNPCLMWFKECHHTLGKT